MHNVLAGSNIFIWVFSIRLAVFLNPKPSRLGGEGYTAMPWTFTQILSLHNVYAQEGMLLFTFFKLVTCPFLSICCRFTFVTIGQLEILSCNIVFHKPIAQCSNQFTTDPN